MKSAPNVGGIKGGDSDSDDESNGDVEVEVEVELESDGDSEMTPASPTSASLPQRSDEWLHDLIVTVNALRPSAAKLRDLTQLIRDNRLPVSPRVGGRGGRTKSNIIDELSQHLGQGPLPVPIGLPVQPVTPARRAVAPAVASTARRTVPTAAAARAVACSPLAVPVPTGPHAGDGRVVQMLNRDRERRFSGADVAPTTAAPAVTAPAAIAITAATTGRPPETAVLPAAAVRPPEAAVPPVWRPCSRASTEHPNDQRRPR